MGEFLDLAVEVGDLFVEPADRGYPPVGYLGSCSAVSGYELGCLVESGGSGEFPFDCLLVAGVEEGQVGVEAVSFLGTGRHLL